MLHVHHFAFGPKYMGSRRARPHQRRCLSSKRNWRSSLSSPVTVIYTDMRLHLSVYSRASQNTVASVSGPCGPQSRSPPAIITHVAIQTHSGLRHLCSDSLAVHLQIIHLFTVQPTVRYYLIQFTVLLRQNSMQYFPCQSLHCQHLLFSIIYFYCILMSNCLFIVQMGL